jgi:hypothetical protein
MVEQSAVNRWVVGSSPTSGAILSSERSESALDPKEIQNIPGHLGEESEQQVNFPKRLRFKGKGKVLATIYKRPNCYQLYWRQRDANGKLKSWFKDFALYSVAKKHGDKVIADLAKGKQTPLLSVSPQRSFDGTLHSQNIARHWLERAGEAKRAFFQVLIRRRSQAEAGALRQYSARNHSSLGNNVMTLAVC